jgi:hypothetical protein
MLQALSQPAVAGFCGAGPKTTGTTSFLTDAEQEAQYRAVYKRALKHKQDTGGGWTTAVSACNARLLDTLFGALMETPIRALARCTPSVHWWLQAAVWRVRDA